MHCNDSLWSHPDNFILIIQYITSLVIVGSKIPKMYSICIHVGGLQRYVSNICLSVKITLYCLNVFSQTIIVLHRASKDPYVFTITEKAPTWAFSWLKALSHIRHYAKQTWNWHTDAIIITGDRAAKFSQSQRMPRTPTQLL